MNIGDKTWEKTIQEGLSAFGLGINDKQLNQLTCFANELIKWNQIINLTRITKPEDIAIKHMIDSMIPCSYVPESSELIDMGSGAGFPGIPMKILFPSYKVHLIDSSIKKIRFLEHVIQHLSIDHIDVVHSRGELLSSKRFTGDVIISRAFSDLSHFVQVSYPLLNPNGKLIAMKGKPPVEEINAFCSVTHRKKTKHNYAACLHYFLKTYELPYSLDARSLVILSKKLHEDAKLT
ncbi:MAG: 16S rRNA (guanine(527)-N(7))-methyltransferase RsmG [Desulfobacterales bacterium]|nr:16S rRNA (guanine(527)-N(7))-methyltransferase RsmG [Desulfobacterales bacterium]